MTKNSAWGSAAKTTSSAWSAVKKDPRIAPELQELVNDFALTAGRVSMPLARLKVWLERHARLSAATRAVRGKEVVALAVRFARLGPGSAKAVAQLCVLAEALLKT